MTVLGCPSLDYTLLEKDLSAWLVGDQGSYSGLGRIDPSGLTFRPLIARRSRMDVMNTEAISKRPRHSFQTDDRALEPIADKVQRGERLNFEDGVALYRSG